MALPARFLLLWGRPRHGWLLMWLLEMLTTLPAAMNKVEAVYLEFMPGVIRYSMHVPFQQTCKIMYNLLQTSLHWGPMVEYSSFSPTRSHQILMAVTLSNSLLFIIRLGVLFY